MSSHRTQKAVSPCKKSVLYVCTHIGVCWMENLRKLENTFMRSNTIYSFANE